MISLSDVIKLENVFFAHSKSVEKLANQIVEVGQEVRKSNRAMMEQMEKITARLTYACTNGVDLQSERFSWIDDSFEALTRKINPEIERLFAIVEKSACAVEKSKNSLISATVLNSTVCPISKCVDAKHGTSSTKSSVEASSNPSSSLAELLNQKPKDQLGKNEMLPPSHPLFAGSDNMKPTGQSLKEAKSSPFISFVSAGQQSAVPTPPTARAPPPTYAQAVNSTTQKESTGIAVGSTLLSPTDLLDNGFSQKNSTEFSFRQPVWGSQISLNPTSFSSTQNVPSSDPQANILKVPLAQTTMSALQTSSPSCPLSFNFKPPGSVAEAIPTAFRFGRATIFGSAAQFGNFAATSTTISAMSPSSQISQKLPETSNSSSNVLFSFNPSSPLSSTTTSSKKTTTKPLFSFNFKPPTFVKEEPKETADNLSASLLQKFLAETETSPSKQNDKTEAEDYDAEDAEDDLDDDYENINTDYDEEEEDQLLLEESCTLSVEDAFVSPMKAAQFKSFPTKCTVRVFESSGVIYVTFTDPKAPQDPLFTHYVYRSSKLGETTGTTLQYTAAHSKTAGTKKLALNFEDAAALKRFVDHIEDGIKVAVELDFDEND